MRMTTVSFELKPLVVGLSHRGRVLISWTRSHNTVPQELVSHGIPLYVWQSTFDRAEGLFRARSQQAVNFNKRLQANRRLHCTSVFAVIAAFAVLLLTNPITDIVLLWICTFISGMIVLMLCIRMQNQHAVIYLSKMSAWAEIEESWGAGLEETRATYRDLNDRIQIHPVKSLVKKDNPQPSYINTIGFRFDVPGSMETTHHNSNDIHHTQDGFVAQNLERLAQLQKSGVLNQREFEIVKQRVLGHRTPALFSSPSSSVPVAAAALVAVDEKRTSVSNNEDDSASHEDTEMATLLQVI